MAGNALADWAFMLGPLAIGDDHLVYALVLVLLTLTGAGRTLGLGGWWESLPIVRRYGALRQHPTITTTSRCALRWAIDEAVRLGAVLEVVTTDDAVSGHEGSEWTHAAQETKVDTLVPMLRRA